MLICKQDPVFWIVRFAFESGTSVFVLLYKHFFFKVRAKGNRKGDDGLAVKCI